MKVETWFLSGTRYYTNGNDIPEDGTRYQSRKVLVVENRWHTTYFDITDLAIKSYDIYKGKNNEGI